MNNETRKDQNTMASNTAGPRIKKAVGAVAAAGVALGGLAVIAPDADAQAYGQTCDLVLNTDAPNRAGYDGGDQHWTRADAQTSMGNMFTVPVYKGAGSVGGGSAVSSPFAPMSTASMAPAGAVAGQVICVVGRHAAIVNGTAGNDTIYGGSGNETINGGGGDDVIFGGAGDDVLIGKAGHDSLDGGAGNDILFGHGGRNSAVSEGTAAQEGRDTLSGGTGDDLLRGDRGDDLLNGNDGDDCLLGGKGNDEAYGWDGDDTIGGGAGADYLAGNDNNDYIFGGKGNDTLRGNDGLDQVWGDSDLFDIGIEMTVAKGPVSISVFGPEPLVTPNGATSSTPNIFISMGELADAKAKYVDGWSSARPVVLMSTISTFTYTLTMVSAIIPVPAAPPLNTIVTYTVTTMRPVATSITVQVLGMTLAHSSLATSQVFSTGAFAALSVAATAVGIPKDRQLGDPLASSGAIMGPLVVPPQKYDTVNSSNLGGIRIPMATVATGKVFRADINLPKKHLHKEVVAVGNPATAVTTTITTGLSVFYAVASVAESTPAGVTPAATLSNGVSYVSMQGPLEPPREHKYASSLGQTVGAWLAVDVVSSSGGFAWGASVVTASTHAHVKFRTRAPGPLTTVPAPVFPVVAESVSFITAPRPAIAPPVNHVAEVYKRFPLDKPHFRTGHLEVAACNLDGIRMMDDVEIPKFAFSGVSLRGLAGMHESMVAASSRGDLEIPLLNNELAAGPGPSGAFLDWPIGVAAGGYDDDIRGGDADDILYGEAGSDTIWGDHGDDTIFGEGDNAAYVLGEAAINVAAGIKSVGGVPTKAWSQTKRKLPIGVEAQYPGSAGNDSLSGNIDDDSIEGGPGNDKMYGGPDDDHLIGDAGSDTQDGGEHWDACQPNGGFVSDCEIVL